MLGPIQRVLSSLLLVWSLLAGQCVLCQHTPPAPHDCCKPAKPDHCNGSNPHQQCPGHDTAFESPGKVEVAAAVQVTGETMSLPAVAPVQISGPVVWDGRTQHPPPERFLLTTVLLI